VRRAVNHAIDKGEIVSTLYGNLAIEAHGPLPPTVFAADPDLRGYPHDAQLAKSLLKEAGYADGFETTLWTMSNPRPYMPQPLRLAQRIQTQLAQVGIRAKIVSFDWGEYLDRVHRGHHDLALLGWQADSGDPDNFLFVHFDKTSAVPPAGNIAFYRGERVHELLQEGRRATEPAERTRVYRDVQETIHKEAPWVPLVHTKELAAVRANVRGYRLHPTGRVLLAGVWIAP
jgi:ABC-type transport system substrate-binding protein